MSDNKVMTVPEVVQLVKTIAGPGTEWEWAARAPGEYPAVCRFCGDPVLVTIIRAGNRVRVGVGHDVPTCPEFARIYEDVTP